MRRENGTGSIYKLSGKRRKPWAASVTIGYDSDGNRLRRLIGTYATKREAAEALALHSINPIPPKNDITVAELFNEWKNTHFRGLSKSSIEMYNASYNHIKPIHGVKFTRLRTAQLQGIVDSAKKSDGSVLSRSAKQKIKILLGLLYSYAIENDICNKNYAEFIKIDAEQKTEKQIFTDLEIKTLFNHVDEPWVDSILFMIYTGFRVQEMLNISKSNVDLKNNIIVGGLKTDAGRNRSVPIHPKIKNIVAARYNTANMYLFAASGDLIMQQNNYRRRIYKPILERLGLSYKTPHSCRHTCASLMARDGVDTMAIKQILGHTNYAFTANTYTHVDVNYLLREISKIK